MPVYQVHMWSDYVVVVAAAAAAFVATVDNHDDGGDNMLYSNVSVTKQYRIYWMSCRKRSVSSRLIIYRLKRQGQTQFEEYSWGCETFSISHHSVRQQTMTSKVHVQTALKPQMRHNRSTSPKKYKKPNKTSVSMVSLLRHEPAVSQQKSQTLPLQPSSLCAQFTQRP